MDIRKFNISKPKKYTDRSGAEKTQWNNIGTITEFWKEDGSVSRIIEIPAINLEASIFPFQEAGEQAPRGRSRQAPQAREPLASQFDTPEDEINPEDIPF